MARRLKTYVTTTGFFELALAAPSMKAALEIWGSKSNLFQQGFAKETNDAEVIKATMEHPGIVLRRPVGSRGVFKEHADLPTFSALQEAVKTRHSPHAARKKSTTKEPRRPDSAASREAAQLYDLAQKRREREEQRAQAQRKKDGARRVREIEKVRAALDEARARHQERIADIEKERDALDRKAQDEDERWDSEKSRLEAALRRAHE